MEFDSEKLFLRLDEMKKNIETASNKEIVDVIKELVPTFTPNNTAYNGSEKEKETVTV